MKKNWLLVYTMQAMIGLSFCFGTIFARQFKNPAYADYIDLADLLSSFSTTYIMLKPYENNLSALDEGMSPVLEEHKDLLNKINGTIGKIERNRETQQSDPEFDRLYYFFVQPLLIGRLGDWNHPYHMNELISLIRSRISLADKLWDIRNRVATQTGKRLWELDADLGAIEDQIRTIEDKKKAIEMNIILDRNNRIPNPYGLY